MITSKIRTGKKMLYFHPTSDNDFQNYILIGPAGAGKSTFAKQLLTNSLFNDHSAILSSDAFRAQYSGDFKNQTVSNKAFDVIYHLLYLRCDLGLRSIVDATNLTLKARNSVMECIPYNSPTCYVLIDRPLQDKLRDGGWRLEVNINGENLIEYHHRIMQENIEMILKGDERQNVTVRDLRT